MLNLTFPHKVEYEVIIPVESSPVMDMFAAQVHLARDIKLDLGGWVTYLESTLANMKAALGRGDLHEAQTSLAILSALSITCMGRVEDLESGGYPYVNGNRSH